MKSLQAARQYFSDLNNYKEITARPKSIRSSLDQGQEGARWLAVGAEAMCELLDQSAQISKALKKLSRV